MKKELITPEMAAAFHHCERKAYLMLQRVQSTGNSPYSAMIEEARIRCKKELEVLLLHRYPQAVPYEPDSLEKGSPALLNARMEHDSRCVTADALIRPRKKNARGPTSFEAIIASPRYKIVPCEKLRLAFVSRVLANQQGTTPTSGSIFTLDGKIHRTNLESQYPAVEKIAASIGAWRCHESSNAPPVIINKHCSECPFQNSCRKTAIGDDNLTLLSGLTPKKLIQYRRKGIFTITQLSYQFRPRRSRSKVRKPTVHRPELQALALRTAKTYVVQVPDMIRSDTEIFLDFEGVPDRKFYYLAGLLVVSKGVTVPYSFWANTPKEESKLWDGILEVIQRYPGAPIFHHGQYDVRACKALAERSGCDFSDLGERFINVVHVIYGNIYFPTYGNGLKELATHLGAKWPSALDSGLKTLVWRQRWEWTHDPRLKQQLLEYNLQDCHALKLLTYRLSDIARLVETDSSLELAHRPKKQATVAGEKLHQDFANILLLGHTRYSEKRIAYVKKAAASSEAKVSTRRRRTLPLKPTKTVLVAPRRKCPKCKTPNIRIRGNQQAKATVADLNYTKNGLRKSVTAYVGPMIFCRRCALMSSPKTVSDVNQGKKYGDGLVAYVAYQRIVLRLPLRTIASSLKELFGLDIPSSTSSRFTTQLSSAHESTERRITERMLSAPYIHCDETRVNIQGANHFAWVMTDGQHVIFRSTETREADWVKIILDEYTGILVSDFYAGYDSVECRQQKCLSHLTKDLNEDLWKEPFNQDFERFADGFKSLIVPIMETIQRYGSKKRNLNKHWKDIDRFYAKFIDDIEHSHETTRKYQKRFNRYRDSLFTFLTEDGIPWNNNMAERALRHLAIQRKISMSFGKEGIHRYLRLLGVAQTCRFQQKSFLKFLLSGGKDVDAFDASRRKPKR